MPIPEISVAEASRRLNAPNPPRLIDVREQEEWDIARIAGAELIPLSQWPQLAQQKITEADQPLLIHCHHGGRSARVTEALLQAGFTDVTNVAGGIDAWSVEIDPTVPRY